LSYFFLEEGTAALLKLLPEDLKEIAKSEKKQVFLKTLKDINEEEIPLFLEIINILNKHRGIRRQDELIDKGERQPSVSAKEKEEYLKAAENREGYGKKDS
jgi:hypothetical protein